MGCQWRTTGAAATQARRTANIVTEPQSTAPENQDRERVPPALGWTPWLQREIQIRSNKPFGIMNLGVMQASLNRRHAHTIHNALIDTIGISRCDVHGYIRNYFKQANRSLMCFSCRSQPGPAAI
jgi:hypothetical protein